MAKFQSTRPRGARPMQQQRQADRFKFQSTRPRGARLATSFLRPCGTCFNPRARAGRDEVLLVQLWTSDSFNPRARAGRDCGIVCFFPRIAVSIHAPARGATCGKLLFDILSLFQSTRPRGARRYNNTANHETYGFNPRARAGRDGNRLLYFSWFRVSIHAPARGATIISRRRHIHFLVSIHAPARGAT